MKEIIMFNKEFEIQGDMIGDKYEPYIIAEMSANHGNNFDNACNIIREAKKCGAHAIKIQTYTADTLTLDCKKKEFEATGAWSGQYLYDLYLDASMPWEWTKGLQAVAKEVGITLFSSPFDFSSVAFLEELNMPAYKIASPEIIDLPLVRRIAQTGKPIIMSSGNATIGQINEAIEIMIEENVKDFALLKCTSEYPASPKDINLKTIQNMQDIFKCPVGLSDHTLGSAIPIASISVFIELAVNIPEHDPPLGQALHSISVSSSSVISPFSNFPTASNAVAKSIGVPSCVYPFAIGPPETNTVGTSTRSPPIIIPGTILSQFGIAIIASNL